MNSPRRPELPIYCATLLLGTVLLLAGFSMQARATEDETYALNSPTISPDGKTIVFVSDHGGDNPSIYTMGIDGKGLRRLTERNTWYSDPEWSPDGRTIACMKPVYSHGSSRECIVLMGKDGSKPRTITPGKHDQSEPAWMPDGKRMVVTTYPNGNADLMLITSGGKEERYVATTTEVESNADCSPDGRWVTYEMPDFRPGSGADTYEAHIWKKSLTPHSKAIQLTTGSHVDSSPHFSPDGTKICFARSRGVEGIYIMNADGTRLYRVPIDAYEAYEPDWSPDGRMIVFVRVTAKPDGNGTRKEICTAKLDGTQLRQITDIEPLFRGSGVR